MTLARTLADEFLSMRDNLVGLENMPPEIFALLETCFYSGAISALSMLAAGVDRVAIYRELRSYSNVLAEEDD